MREILLNVHITLDGVTQAPGGPDKDPRSGFSHGGGASPSGTPPRGRRSVT